MNKTRKIIKLSIIPITVIIFSIFINNINPASAENVNYEVNIEPALSITVTSDGVSTNNVTLDLNPLNHTFDNKSINVNVATNNATGYQLFMSTSNSKTTLDRDNSDGNGIATIDTLPVLEEGYTKDSFIVNKWGYKVTSSDTMPSLVTENYYPFTLNKELSTNHSTTSGDNTTLDFAAKINWDQIAGSYSNTLVFTAVATYAAYDIKYYNGIDNAENQEIAVQTNDYNTSSSVKLEPGVTPTRLTYDFVKWCDTIPGADSNNYFPATTCSGNSYNTGDTITINPEDYNTNIKLYAYWDPTTFEEAYAAAGRTIDFTTNHYTMQTMSKDICAAVTNLQTSMLTDIRDGKDYAARKINDDCWMIDNLNFTNTSMSADTTNIDSAYTTTNPYKVNNGSGYYELSGTEGSQSTGHCYTTGDQKTGNGLYYSCIHSGSNAYSNGTQTWYNYAAASAGTVTGEAANFDAPYDICPRGWQLPDITQMRKILSNKLMLNVHLGGFYYQGLLGDSDSAGFWWSSTTYDDTRSRRLLFYRVNSSGDSQLDIQTHTQARGLGSYVRCLAQN